MPTSDDNEHVLTSLAKLERYCDQVSMQIARWARMEFERKLIGDLMAAGHAEMAAELKEAFDADT